jgi:hypothetical protein
MTGLAGLSNDNESVDGLVDGIRVSGAAARRAFDNEAGPLLQTLNIIKAKIENGPIITRY